MGIIMNANDLFNAVMQLDLTPIKTKLMHVESGEGWSLDKANAVEKEYRRFLCLMKLFPEEQTAPLVDVDTFWHYHILDTMKYAADCEQAFGYFLHHYPYVGMDGTEEDEQFRLDSGVRMQQLYENLFGEAYPGGITADGKTTAFCAGPVPPSDKPAARASDKAGMIAFCAGPVPPSDKPAARTMDKAGMIAFCAGPVPPSDKPAARASDKAGMIAFCAGPVPPSDKPAARASDKAGTIAFCAGPVPPSDKPAARAAGKLGVVVSRNGPAAIPRPVPVLPA
jgi:hypothetical protein